MTDISLADLILSAEQSFESGALDQAEQLASEALQHNPAQPRALQVLGMVLSRNDLPFKAIPVLERALAIQPDLAPAHNELGLAYDRLGDSQLAMRHYEQALILMPGHAFAHFNRGIVNLKWGRFREGWIDYEWRFQAGQVSRPAIPVPRWDGSPLKGKSLLVHTEQGMGDVLQFARFIPVLKRQGARVVLACQQALRPLLQSLSGVDEWIPIDTETPITFDYYTPLLSLAALLGVHSEADIPNRVPYIHADSARVRSWKGRLGSSTDFRIGICWRGSPTYRGDRFRSIPLKHFEAIADVDGVELVSLQKGHDEELHAHASSVPLTVFKDLDQDGVFLDTAALMQSLDLIISCDTSVGHLAGALGRPTWLALSTATDWRWQLDRNDSPWYPTVRLFRQGDLGNWPSVFREMAEALRAATVG